MKKVERVIYERGDHVEVTKGYNKGMVGVVHSHDTEDGDVQVVLANQAIKPKVRTSFWDDDDEMEDASNRFDEGQIKYIAKEEYDAGVKKNNLIRIDGLNEPVQYKGGRFTIGDNPITTANAKKLAEFINKHAKTKAKKK